MKPINTNDSNIDLEQTGKKLKDSIFSAGYTVKDIQKYLQLSCPQSIYRWFNGKILPSVDHLYRLSLLLGMHMEELLVPKRCPLFVNWEYRAESVSIDDNRMVSRWKAYIDMLHAV